MKNNQDINSKSRLDSIARMLEIKNINKEKELKLDSNNINANNNQPDNLDNTFNPYEESSQTLSLLKKDDSTDLDRTRKILFELSDLMTNFSFKVQQHHEMTQQSNC